MNKHANAAFDLVLLAHRLSGDTSDFGKMCVAELYRMADTILDKVAVDAKMTLKMLLEEVKAIAQEKDEAGKLRAIETLWQSLNDKTHQDIINRYGKAMIAPILEMLGAALQNYGPSHDLQKKKKVIEDALHRIIQTPQKN